MSNVIGGSRKTARAFGIVSFPEFLTLVIVCENVNS